MKHLWLLFAAVLFALAALLPSSNSEIYIEAEKQSRAGKARWEEILNPQGKTCDCGFERVHENGLVNEKGIYEKHIFTIKKADLWCTTLLGIQANQEVRIVPPKEYEARISIDFVDQPLSRPISMFGEFTIPAGGLKGEGLLTISVAKAPVKLLVYLQ